MKGLGIAVLIAVLAAPHATAQPGKAGGAGHAAMQAAREARMQEMNARVMRLQQQVTQLNHRLLPMKMHEGFKNLGTGMAQACDRLQEMEQHRLRLAEDPALAGDGGRTRAMRRLEDRLQVMNREMEEAHDALQGLVAMPERPGAPPDAAEQMIRAQRQQEMEQVMTRTNERLRAAEAWSKGDKVSPAARELTKSLALMRDTLRKMNETCNAIAEDPVMEPDRDRLRQVDRIRDRLQVMTREIEEAADALEGAATVPSA